MRVRYGNAERGQVVVVYVSKSALFNLPDRFFLTAIVYTTLYSPVSLIIDSYEYHFDVVSQCQSDALQTCSVTTTAGLLVQEQIF